MKVYKLAKGEAKFADIIWDNEPISSTELVRICETEMNWKKSTTYTVLKKLCTRGIFENKSAIVSSVVSRDEFYSMKSKQFVEDTFGGSLPRFLTAFIGKEKLSDQQIKEMKQLIDSYKGEGE